MYWDSACSLELEPECLFDPDPDPLLELDPDPDRDPLLLDEDPLCRDGILLSADRTCSLELEPPCPDDPLPEPEREPLPLDDPLWDP